jgi:hypothetical protein
MVVVHVEPPLGGVRLQAPADRTTPALALEHGLVFSDPDAILGLEQVLTPPLLVPLLRLALAVVPPLTAALVAEDLISPTWTERTLALPTASRVRVGVLLGDR